MKKIAILFLLSIILASSCSLFDSKKKMKDYISRLENTIKEDSLAYAASMDKMKSEMQSKLDSISQACNQSKGNYHIITGSFREQQNASNFVAEMEKLGYKAQIIDAPNGFHLVSVSAGSNLQQMFSTLNNIRGSVNEESWIYIKN